MQDEKGRVLYIGKAKNLKKRVTSYFKRQLDAKTLQLVQKVHSIEVTITRNEREALLLENNLIKAEKPRYNVLFRDDKSYPYLVLSDGPYPQLTMQRGLKKGNGKYYGPYPSSREARDALQLLQSIFRLRLCDDVFFKGRTRPCLQYQIKRCSGPCVGLIDPEDYRRDVEVAKLFLEGRNHAVIEHLISKMEQASQDLNFEQAGRLRDQIALLRGIQERQIIMGSARDMDVLGIAVLNHEACVHVLMIREGSMVGSRQYHPNKTAIIMPGDNEAENVLQAFILQHYGMPEDEESFSYPKTILLPFSLSAATDIVSFLQEKIGVTLELVKAVRGDRLQWVTMATNSAKQALISRHQARIDLSLHFAALQESLHLDKRPERIECFDVSHALGEATVVSCVAFEMSGPQKSGYRRFNIRSETDGNDPAALTEGLTRHYGRLKSKGGVFPDIVLIDGGKAQLMAAQRVLTELELNPVLLSVAKGEGRRVGLETLYRFVAGKILRVSFSELAFQLILKCRDEAHRFAITAHRNQRARRRVTSTLEDISGIGNKRRQNLLHYFGGLQEVRQASIEELAKVPGINRSLAERLYQALHGN